jgi:hypothetical protein
MNFTKNVGLIDQLLRALLTIDLAVPCLLGLTTGIAAFLMVSFAIVLSISCVTGYCLFYDTLAVTTRQ